MKIIKKITILNWILIILSFISIIIGITLMIIAFNNSRLADANRIENSSASWLAGLKAHYANELDQASTAKIVNIVALTYTLIDLVIMMAGIFVGWKYAKFSKTFQRAMVIQSAVSSVIILALVIAGFVLTSNIGTLPIFL